MHSWREGHLLRILRVQLLRVRSAVIGRIALLAVLLASIVPSLTYAFGLTKGAAWVVVCTAQGSRWVQGDAGGDGSAPASRHVLEHCSYCLNHAPDLALPSAPEPTPLIAEGRRERLRVFQSDRYAQGARVSAQPRAPPQGA